MKLVCIKQCTYSFYKLDYHFNVGDQFELSSIEYQTWDRPDKISIVIEPNNPGYNFNGEKFNVKVLTNDFIPLEEWREQQLNKLNIILI
jgi:hypothetical protein